MNTVITSPLQALGKAYLAGDDTPISTDLVTEFSRWVETDYLLETENLDVYFVNEPDIYSGYQDIREDILNGYLATFNGGDPLAAIPHHINLKFRTIHDISHAAYGLNFCPEDEYQLACHTVRELAIKGHSKELQWFVYCEIAAQAAAWEVLGGSFAAQKFVKNLPGFPSNILIWS